MSDTTLTEEELDTLLDGVSTGSVDTNGDTAAKGQAISFNFKEQYNILLGKMPRLGRIFDSFLKNLSASVENLMDTEAEITLAQLGTSKYGEFMRSLPEPAHINTLEISPLHTSALAVLEPRLLYILVDKYFGGQGGTHGLEEGRDLTLTERRIADQLLALLVEDFQAAWQIVDKIGFTHRATDTVPDTVQVMSANEVIVVAMFQITLGGASGNVRFALPYSLLEHYRSTLEARAQTEKIEVDQVWQQGLATELNRASVNATGKIEGLSMKLSELLSLNVGDVVPFEMPSLISLDVEHIPIFKGTLGSSNGRNAVRIREFTDLTQH